MWAKYVVLFEPDTLAPHVVLMTGLMSEDGHAYIWTKVRVCE